MSESVDDRRQRATAEFWDASQGHMTGAPAGVAAAIEVATTVKITHDVVMAFIEAPDDGPDDITGPLRAAFEAAGFEVVE